MDEWLVYLQSASGVDDECVAIVGQRKFGRFAGDAQNIVLAVLGEDGLIQLLAKCLELIHRCGTIDIGGDEKGRASLLAEESRQFPSGGCFAGAV